MENYKTFKLKHGKKSLGITTRQIVLRLDTKNMIHKGKRKLINWPIKIENFCSAEDPVKRDDKINYRVGENISKSHI